MISSFEKDIRRLGFEKISDEGAKAIGHALRRNNTLQTLRYVKREREEWVGWDV